MKGPRDRGGIRHRNQEYDSRRGLIWLIIAGGVVVSLLVISVEIGLVGAIAENVEDSMHTPRGNSAHLTPRSHTGPDGEWRLSLNRGLDDKYTTNENVRQLEVRTAQLEVMRFVNAQRAEQGVEPLFWNGELSRLNRWYAQEIHQMNRAHSFHENNKTGRDSHGRAEWAGYPVERCTLYGEVIIGPTRFDDFDNPDTNAAAITEAWMRSDSHREGILNEQYDVAGVGIFVAKDDTLIAVMTLCDRAHIPDEELNGWEDARYRGGSVAIPYEVAVAGGEWDSTGNLTRTPTTGANAETA